ncbi:hypothetical protein O181_064812 [Austropuccinia psidii MF-1]|uniref:Uncharacterized protein n=1 Tax=Austropuccinia psidii MF-1 TaxID=1389203 RepID=A0A9Q3ESC4_9BASI|nr:hypothetical protein [Austropuccinia psidii MF-1]
MIDVRFALLHISIVTNNSSPNFPSNAKSSHTISAPDVENPKNNLLPSQSNPPTPSNAPTPGIRDPSNHLSHMGPSPPILDETHQDPPSSQPLGSPNDQFSTFTDEF